MNLLELDMRASTARGLGDFGCNPQPGSSWAVKNARHSSQAEESMPG